MIKQFKIYSKMHFSKELTYRASSISGTITQFFFGLLQIMVFLAFYNSNANVVEFTIIQMCSYIWMKQIFFSYFKFYNYHKTLANQIVNGDIAYQLIKPVNLYSQWFFDMFAANSAKFAFRGPIVFVVSLLLPVGLGLMLPVSSIHLLLFALSMLLGVILVVSINLICYILVTITMSPGAVFGVVNAVASVLAGQIVPIPIFPKFAQPIINALPFRYTLDLPIRIYTGNIAPNEAIWQILIQIVWIVAFVVFGKWFLNKRLNKLVVQGG